MRSLSECASLTEEDKISHIQMLIDKRREKSDVSSILQTIHDLRLKCLIMGYFGNMTPSIIEEQIPNLSGEYIDTENIRGIQSEEKILIRNFMKALECIKYGEMRLFDVVDKQFRSYRYRKWRNESCENNWERVEKRSEKRRGNQLLKVKIQLLE